MTTYQPQTVPVVGKTCECSRPAAHRIGGEYICARCRELDGQRFRAEKEAGRRRQHELNQPEGIAA